MQPEADPVEISQTTFWILGGAIIAAMVALFIPAWLHARREAALWSPVPEMPFKYRADAPVTGAEVAQCITVALTCLSKHVPGWSITQMVQRFANTRIRIMPTEHWYDSEQDKNISGSCKMDLGTIWVGGPSMATMCHEFGHLGQDRIDLVVPDWEHKTWVGSGLQAAEDEFKLDYRRPSVADALVRQTLKRV